MDLERVAAVVRPRTEWESVDLGFAMARAWWRPVFAAWLLVLVPVWLLAGLVLASHLEWAFLVVWVLRPVLDRVPLFVLSRALFGATPGLAAVARELPRLLRGYLPQALVLYRLSPFRSLHLPVWELEGLRGRDRFQRSRLIGREGVSVAGLLTAGCVLLEFALALGTAGLVSVLFPERAAAFDLKAWTEGGPVSGHDGLTVFALAFLAHAFVEPFYVAAGFALYLNRRTHLEGWDVEIAFRRLARRIARLGGVAALALLAVAAAPSAAASDVAAEPPERTLERVLSEPEFAAKRTVRRWRRIGEGGAARPATDTAGTAVRVAAGAASLVRPAVVVALLAVFVLLALRVARTIREERAEAGDERPRAAPVLGALAVPERLPADVPAHALGLWERGARAAALSVLYRGAVQALVADGASLDASSTEAQCLAAATSRGPAPRADYVRRLLETWQALAYAHREPPDADGRSLCSGFARAFPASPRPEGGRA